MFGSHPSTPILKSTLSNINAAFFFFFWWDCGLTQGFAVAKQAL
jgi:hypothetical protein